MAAEAPILIVDDDEGVCVLLRGALKKIGLASDTCNTGRDTLAYLATHKPPLMLLDLRLPDMKGQELLDRLAQDGRRVPFIVVSGMADIRVAVQLMQEGALDFLAKDTQLLQLVGPVVKRSLAALENARRLAETERRFQQMAENIQAVFWIAAPDFSRFLYVSPAFRHIWGVTEESLAANPRLWMESVMPTDRPTLALARRRLGERGEKIELEYRIRRPDGDLRWIYDSGFAVRDGTGAIESITGIARDITPRKEMEGQVLEAAETERRRIGRDLHDDLCQRLAALKLRCGMLQRALSREHPEQSAALSDLSAELADATALARNIARGLAPVTLESDGLVAALEAMAQSSGTMFRIPCRFECPSPVAVPDPTTAAHLFRIAQELTANAAKHASPNRIVIRLEELDDRVLLSVTNDGTPFRRGPRTKSGMGLHFIQQRADAIGATINIEPGPEPDGGTRIACTLPLSITTTTNAGDSPEPL